MKNTTVNPTKTPKNRAVIKKHAEKALTTPLKLQAAPDNMSSEEKKPASAINRSAADLKSMEFKLEAPAAKSVQLAGDFTDWEKSALKMTRADGGVWKTIVPLSPGHYTYRFIVDGCWCDDPRCSERAPNPFGTTNAIVNVN